MNKHRFFIVGFGFLAVFLSTLFSCKRGKEGAEESDRSYIYQSKWNSNPGRGLPGDKWHLVTTADWKINGDRLECSYQNESDPTQMAFFLDSLFGHVSKNFGVEAVIGPVKSNTSVSKFSEGGFLISGESLFHPVTKGFYAGLDGEGKLFMRNYQTNRYFQHSIVGEPVPEETRLELKAFAEETSYTMILYQWDPSTGELKDSLSMRSINPDLIKGRVALVSRSGYGEFATPWWFKDLKLFEIRK